MNRIFLVFVPAIVFIIASCSAGGTVVPTAAPQATQTPLPTATATATASITPPSYPERTDPQGVAVVQDKGMLLAFYDFDGNLLGTRSLLPSGSSSDFVHVSGSSSAGLESLTVIRVKQAYPKVVVLEGDRQILLLDGALNGFTALPGQPVIAFGTVQPATPGPLLSKIFLGTPYTLNEAEPVFMLEGPYGGILTPLRIQMESGSPAGIWYTLRLYGIGGDIIFDPTHDLYYLDLGTGVSTEFTIPNDDISQPVFSPDEAWLSYVSHGSMKFYNMQNGETFSIPHLPESDRGGGDVTFSPDNHYTAWKEAHGFRWADVPEYYAVLRIAVTGEGPRHDFTEFFFEQIAGYAVADMTPVTWLDGQTLLVSLSNENGGRQLWKLDLTGPTPHLLAEGQFVGFIYP